MSSITNKCKIEKVENVKCKAIADGYANGRVIKAGSSFLYSGNLKDGAFPLWVESLEAPKKKEAAVTKAVAAPAKKVAKKASKKVVKKVDSLV